MNTKARPETKKTEPEATPTPNFTVQQIENRLVAVLAPGAVAPVPQISANSWHFSGVTWLELAGSVRCALGKGGAFPVK